MAHVATSSSSTASRNSAPLSPTDINFEDLITVNSVLLDETTGEEIAQSDSDEMRSPTNNSEELFTIETTLSYNTPTTETVTITRNVDAPVQQKFVNLTKILPKQTTVSAKNPASVKGSSSGQVVIIQGPSGPVPIRIAGSTTATSNRGGANATSTTGNVKTTVTSPKDSTANKGQPVTIQVLKMPDGSLVPVKKNKTLNLTNLSNISKLNVNSSGMPVIVKTSNVSKTVLGSQSKLTSGSQVLKSLTLAEAQKAGFLKPKSLDSSVVNRVQRISPSSTSTTTISSVSSATTARSGATKEVTIKSETDGTTKKIVVPQHMLKLQSGSGAGPIQAIQIPGKQGLQYVRVLAPGSSGSGARVVNTFPKDGSPTKTQRVVMNSNVKPGLSMLSSTKDVTASNKGNMRLVSTVPMLRKIQDGTTPKVINTTSQVDKEQSIIGGNSKQMLQIKKVNTTVLKSNQPEPKLLNTQIASGTYNQNTASHSVVRKVEQRITPTDEMPRLKQYSTLKSPPLQLNLQRTPDFVEDPMAMMLGKRSPTPEALRRKHCNCTKSQCLKLYCDCFANGEFCQDCNCKECFNNLEYEDERQKAIKICLERNPNAFKPKITKAKDQSDLRLHNKGCNCKRSGCLKNYCECYEAKIACSSNCKCFGCRNVEDRSDRDLFEDAQGATVQSDRTRAVKRHHEEVSERAAISFASGSARQQDGQPANKQPYNFITQDVVDATIQCMVAQADECKKNGMSKKITERMVIEELGRCLVEIIDFSIRNIDN